MDENTTAPPAAPDNNKPEKYIRTFAGDMETLQGGGTPDLAPLIESAPRAKERLIAESPLPRMQMMPPPEPEPPVVSEPDAPPPPPIVAPLKTYAGDFSDRMKQTHASAVTVLAAEQDSAQGEPEAPPQEPPHSNLSYIIVGAVLLVAGAAGSYFAYTSYKAANTPVAVAPAVSAPIFVDDREQISGVGTALSQAIMKSVNRLIPTGSIRLLYLSADPSLGSVFASLDVGAPGVLLRNINAAQSMAGVVNANGVQSPFFILSVASYSDTFSGMLSWEPVMRRNLIAIFPPYPIASATTTPAGSATTTAATSTAPVSVASATTFADETVANHDVRIYRDTAGQSVMLYGYWNPTTLVIARDPAAFTEIVQRLSTSRAQP